MSSIDVQINNALREAQIALLKLDRLRELNMRSAEIKTGMGCKARVMSEGTRQRLLSLVMRKA